MCSLLYAFTLNYVIKFKFYIIIKILANIKYILMMIFLCFIIPQRTFIFF